MNYCKFENTNIDVRQCLNSLRNRDVTSDRELEYARTLLIKVFEFLDDEGLINNGELDKNSLDDLLNTCKDKEMEEE